MRQRIRLGRLVCVLVLAGAAVLVGRGLAGQATESAPGPHVADSFCDGLDCLSTRTGTESRTPFVGKLSFRHSQRRQKMPQPQECRGAA